MTETDHDETLDQRVDSWCVMGLQVIVGERIALWPTDPVTSEIAGVDIDERLIPEADR
jgi:hypothetical protein